MSDNEVPVTHDDVNTAFGDRRFFNESDDRLLKYLGVLCVQQIRSDEVRLLANNRCITINTLLTKRYTERANRFTTFLAIVVIVLTAASIFAPFISHR